MAYKLVDWLTHIKLNTWRSGHVQDVGYVKLDDAEADLVYGWRDEDVELRSCGLALSTHLSLVKLVDLSDLKMRGASEHRLWMAVRDVFSGVWKVQSYRLTCLHKESWIREVKGQLKRGNHTSHIYQISKQRPFELKERGNFAVYGKELPQSRRFKS